MSKQGKGKLNIKEKLYEDNLDLSVCGLETVPVKEIVDLPKVRKLNLSFNLLITLPDDFIKLQNIIELDLSKNKLKSLPKNFGNLTNLKTLDLLGNELTTLPATFCELKSLQWLDLKDNPLHPQLKQAAGDCFDTVQCKKCAVNVIAFVKNLAAEEERQRQLELKRKREQQQKKDAEEKQKADQLKLLKKQERDQRRIANEQRKQETTDSEDVKKQVNGQNEYNKTEKRDIKKTKSGIFNKIISTFRFFLLIALLSIAIYVLLVNVCPGGNKDLRQGIQKNTYLSRVMVEIDKHACPIVIKNKPIFERYMKSFKF